MQRGSIATRSESLKAPWRRDLLILGVAIALLMFHIGILRQWVVDDAGITFAYSRNLASGHGLVAQAGTPPVEGFSNPLWTLLVAALYVLGVFDPTVTSKAVAGALLIITFGLIWHDLRRNGRPVFLALPLLWLAACTPFVVWTTSGLENALLALLIVALASTAVHAMNARDVSIARDVTAGALSGLAALTRPDAVVYAAVYPTLTIFSEYRRNGVVPIRMARRLACTAAGFLPIYGGYLLFRLAYFGEWMPNTFYAKQKPALAFVSAGKLADLLAGVTGDFFLPIAVCLGGGLLFLILRRCSSLRTLVLMAYSAVSVLIYAVMPADWMGEFRFATPFFPLFFWGVTAALLDLLAVLAPGRRVMLGLAVAACLFVVQLTAIFAARTLSFADHPTVPLAAVQEYAGDGFNELAAVLHLKEASLLTPDLGGALLDSKLRIYDLAGLCDRRIALALSSGDSADLRKYVFEEVRPTFIHTHGAFTRASRLHEDPRFATDYVPIFEHRQGPDRWAQLWPPNEAPPWSGDYVRRDVLGPGNERLADLRARYYQERLEQFAPWVRPPDHQGWFQSEWAVRALAARVEPELTSSPVVNPQ